MGNDTLTREFGVKEINPDLLGLDAPYPSDQRAIWTKAFEIKKLSWLTDYKLGGVTVLPAAGFLTLAAEALLQLHEARGITHLGVILRQVHINSILIAQEKNEAAKILTELHPVPRSSEKWWSFTISSVVGDVSTIHATGRIAGLPEISIPNPKFDEFSVASMEDQDTRPWYDKFAEEGLQLGPQFRSLTKIYNDGATKSCRTLAETRLLSRNDGVGHDQHSNYLLHAITLDSLLQTALISSAGGSISRLGVKFPVSIEAVEIMLPPPATFSSSCRIYAKSTSVGLGMVRCDAELRSSTRLVLIKMGDIQCVPAFEDDAYR
jgi:Polyketide synthase dehydratase